MQAMDVSTLHHDPPAYAWLQRFLPAIILVNTFANFFTLLISIGAYGPARRFWREFETFIALAWLFFLMALTLGSLAQVMLTYHRSHVLDAFGRGRDGYRKWRDGGNGSKTLPEKFAVAFVVKMPLAPIITLLTLLGFMFCCLCVVSHTLAVGWIGFGWTIMMMVLTIIAWALMKHE